MLTVAPIMNSASSCEMAMDVRLSRTADRDSDRDRLTARNLHSAPRKTRLGVAEADGISMTLERVQWSKDRSRHVLHASPSLGSSSGFQRTDFLRCLGFLRCAQCQVYGECYVRTVPEGFSLRGLGSELENAYAQLSRADMTLGRCGVSLPQKEGIGYSYDQPSVAPQRSNRLSGNGHDVIETTEIKRSQDRALEYRLTFVKDRTEKGFVTHYGIKSGNHQREYSSALRFLGFDSRDECSEFDFEPCHYTTLKTGAADQYIIDANTVNVNGFAHRAFDAHTDHFSSGLELILAANKCLCAFGLPLLSDEPISDKRGLQFESHQTDHAHDNRLVPKNKRTKKATEQYEYDVTLSVAGPDREYAQQLHDVLVANDIRVFYDEAFEASIWGKDLATTLFDLCNNKARYFVLFVSRAYQDRIWTMHELRSALDRAVREKGSEYILPVRIDDIELRGLSPSIAYVSIDKGIEWIAEKLIEKIEASKLG